ncbi:MAG: nucleotide sugar dehydrogenase [Planctomycetota bacterium]
MPADDHFGPLRRSIETRSARISVVGLGYVGLPLLAAVADAGFPAIGVDRDASKITDLRAGRTYLPHLPDSIIRSITSATDLTLADDRAALAGADIILLCVPTPLDEQRRPDLSAVEAASDEIARHAVGADSGRPRLVVLESSTFPGTTRGVVAPRVLAPAPGAPIAFAYSPEREDPGNARFTTRTIPKLVGGLDEAGTALAVSVYERIVETVVPCRTAEVAEAAKLVENVYRSINIALVNELKIVLDALGLDVWEVLDAAATKPFGFHRFNPGPGLGGHCVPIDPFYLSWLAREAGVESRFIELAGEINHAMPGYVVQKTEAALGERGVPLDGARVLVLGVAYKKNVADIRESPAFPIIEQVRARGAAVDYHDPHVPRTHKGRRRDYEMTSIDWSLDAVASYDAVIVVTDHDWYDWDGVASHARVLVDSRAVVAPSRATRA